MLGKLLDFTRRTKSKYVEHKAVDDFTRVLDQVFAEPDKAGEYLDELAKIVGADGLEPDAGPMLGWLDPKYQKFD